jgi:hypothetical protein
MTNQEEAHAKKERFRQRLGALGFDDVRFASAAAPVRGGLPEWLDAGMQADMHWMERTRDKRLNPELVLPGVRSVIMLGVNYWSDRLNFGAASSAPRWARYALHEDYHDTVKPGLVAAGKALEEIYGVAPGARAELGRAGGPRLRRQERDAHLAAPRQLALPRGDPHARRAGAGRAGEESFQIGSERGRAALRQMHAVPRRVSDRRLPAPGRGRCAALHLLPDDREQGHHPARAARRHRPSHLRLRRVPRGLPVRSRSRSCSK